MRLVDFEEFCRMPAGTIFAPFADGALEERLAIKVDAGRDMLLSYKYYTHMFNGVMPLEPWNIGPSGLLWEIGDTDEASFETYDGDNNDYVEYKMFVVFDEHDINKMIGVLKWAKNGCEGDPDYYIEREAKPWTPPPPLPGCGKYPVTRTY